jgi:hypothetical protein
MRLAMMQPYFFPYIGYFQLMHAADVFVLADGVQFMQGGWIARNRIIGPKGWAYINAPLAARPVTARIGEVRLAAPERWKGDMLRALLVYRRAPFFAPTIALIEDLLRDCDASGIAGVNAHLLTGLAAALGLACRIERQSSLGIDYGHVRAPGDWAAETAAALGASHYINPVNGAAFHFDHVFAAKGCALRFLRPHELLYEQGQAFEPRLSIIDALMALGLAGVTSKLPHYDLLTRAEAMTG